MRVTFPGLVDLQVNGFAGVDFNTPGASPERIRHAIAAMRATGVTRCLPTLITSSFERFAACADALCACDDAALVGIHLEGPYISPVDGPRGAHPVEHVRDASVADFARRQAVAGGRIRLVTLAPEVPGAIALIEFLTESGVRVALGHTAASRGIIREAIRAGATLSTHLGNGCAQMQHRHDNVIWEQLAADELCASFIVDGHHLPPSVVKAMLRAKGLARSLLVTDAMAAAATSPGDGGRYTLGELEVELGATGRVSQPGTPNLAGSALTMDVAVGNTVRFSGLRLEDVLPLASTQPARFMGVECAGTVTAEWNAAEGRLSVVAVSDVADGVGGVRSET